MRYRLVGVPAPYSTADELLIEDEQGELYLLDRNAAYPEPVARADVPMIFTFYEPVVRTRWTDLGELSVMRLLLAPFAPSSYDMPETLEQLLIDL